VTSIIIAATGRREASVPTLPTPVFVDGTKPWIVSPNKFMVKSSVFAGIILVFGAIGGEIGGIFLWFYLLNNRVTEMQT
jgi:hypothetical protein